MIHPTTTSHPIALLAGGSSTGIAQEGDPLRAQGNAYDGATIEALRADVNELMPALERVRF